jgi:hypothetical protein
MINEFLKHASLKNIKTEVKKNPAKAMHHYVQYQDIKRSNKTLKHETI